MEVFGPSDDEEYASQNSKKKVSQLEQRRRRKLSQDRHRSNVATCYQKLRMSVPGSVDGNEKRTLCSSIKARGNKTVNKADLLHRASDYVVYLENVVKELLDKKKCMRSYNDRDKLFMNVIGEFHNLSDISNHFASNFEINRQAIEYFTPNVSYLLQPKPLLSRQQKIPCHVTATTSKKVRTKEKISKPESPFLSMKTKFCSPTRSDDLGFVSADGGSQEQAICRTKLAEEHSYNDIQGRTGEYHRFGRSLNAFPVGKLPPPPPSSMEITQDHAYVYYPPDIGNANDVRDLYEDDRKQLCHPSLLTTSLSPIRPGSNKRGQEKDDIEYTEKPPSVESNNWGVYQGTKRPLKERYVEKVLQQTSSSLAYPRDSHDVTGGYTVKYGNDKEN